MRAFIEASADWLESGTVCDCAEISRIMRDLAPHTGRRVRPNACPPVTALNYLDDALAMPGSAPIAAALKSVAWALPWTVAPAGKLTSKMEGRYTFASIIGPDELIHSDTIRFGAFLVAPDTVYPSHWHAAEEIYMIVSGTAHWNIEDHAYAEVQPGSVFRHRPWQAHATTTSSQPMLALWAWRGDIRADKYGIETDEVDPNLPAAGLFSVSPD